MAEFDYSGKKEIIIEEDANTTYICVAPRGTLETDARWQIKRVLVEGTKTTIELAGTGEPIYTIADRLTETYS
jgi:hypothetical protein